MCTSVGDKKGDKDGDNHAGAKLKSKVSYHNFVKDLLPPLRHLFSHACPLAASQPGRETWTDMCLEAAQRDSSLYPEKQKSNGAFVLCPYKNKAIFSEGFILCRGPHDATTNFPELECHVPAADPLWAPVPLLTGLWNNLNSVPAKRLWY